MKNRATTIKTFFAFQFTDAHISKSDREVALIEAINQANGEIRKKHTDCTIEWEECKLESGKPIGQQILSFVSACDIFVADLSEGNRNVLFELGIAFALQEVEHKNILWLVHESVDLTQLPSDIRGLYIEKYSKQSLRPILAQKIRDISFRAIELKKQSFDSRIMLRDFWGFQPYSQVDIVCAEIPENERHYFADPNDRNYLRYAKFADLDTLIYVKTNIAQLFTHVHLRDFSPSEYLDTNTLGLVVIGGPPWNSTFREFQSQLPFHFIPRPLGEDDPLCVHALKNCLFHPVWSTNKNLLHDISLFVRIRIQKGVPIFLIGGCLTFGVLGAAKCFLDNVTGVANVEYIESLVDGRDFVLVFETERIGGFVKTTDLCHRKPLVLLLRDEMNEPFKLLVDNSQSYRLST